MPMGYDPKTRTLTTLYVTNDLTLPYINTLILLEKLQHLMGSLVAQVIQQVL